MRRYLRKLGWLVQRRSKEAELRDEIEFPPQSRKRTSARPVG